jgi:cyclophilin family peptidyl-prolyl cis-trans isomerase
MALRGWKGAGMIKRVLIAAGLLSLVALPGAAHAAPWVRVTTSMGDFTIELSPERAPLTVANFLKYVKEGYYSGTLFHRIVGNFVVQGGGYTTDYKLKPAHEAVVNESGNGLQNKRGTVGLARAEGPHSGTSQFYVNVGENPDLDPVPTRWGYAVFGRVVQGMEVVERIGVLPTGKAGPFKGDAPLTPVVIEKVELLNDSPVQTPPAATAPGEPVTPSPAPQSAQPAKPAE